MKITILQQDLLPALQSAYRSVGSRSSLPVLDNLLLATENGRLKVAATNLELGVIRYLPVEVEEAGELTVPAKTLVEVVSGIGPAKIEFNAQGEVLTIQSGKFKASINGIPASEFPAIPEVGGGGVSFLSEVFNLSSQILFAAATDEGRPILTGILTDAHEGILDLVSTDGFRLAHRQIKLPDQSAEFKALIPRRTFEEVLRIIGEDKAENVSLASSGNQNQIVFTIGQTIVSSRLIEGRFPSWEKIIPQSFVSRAIVDKDQLLKAVKLAAVFAKNEANIVILKTGSNLLSLQSSAKQLGSQENEVEGEVEGERLEIAFNSKFLTDALTNAPSSQLMMEFSGALSPTLIKPMGVEGLQYIVMPVRLS